MVTQRERSVFGPVQIGIIIATLITAFVHWFLVLSLLRENRSPVMFLLNGLGYIGLLAALFMPRRIVDRFLPPQLAQIYRPLVRYALMGYALLTIILWAVIGPEISPIAIFTKLTEAVLIVLLWLDRRRDE